MKTLRELAEKAYQDVMRGASSDNRYEVGAVWMRSAIVTQGKNALIQSVRECRNCLGNERHMGMDVLFQGEPVAVYCSEVERCPACQAFMQFAEITEEEIANG